MLEAGVFWAVPSVWQAIFIGEDLIFPNITSDAKRRLEDINSLVLFQ